MGLADGQTDQEYYSDPSGNAKALQKLEKWVTIHLCHELPRFSIGASQKPSVGRQRMNEENESSGQRE